MAAEREWCDDTHTLALHTPKLRVSLRADPPAERLGEDKVRAEDMRRKK